MTYYPKYVEDFVKTPKEHIRENLNNKVILTSVIISTVQKPAKVEHTNYACDLECFYMPTDMQKSCFVITFDEDMNVVAGNWFKEHELTKISCISKDEKDELIFRQCLERYEGFLEKLKNELDYNDFNS